MSAVMREQAGIRPAHEYDLDRIMQIEESAYPFPWTRGLIKECLNNQDYFYVLIEQDEIIGYAVMSCGAEAAHLLNLAVDPAWQSRGYGHRLLMHLLSTATRHRALNMFLEVRASNTPGQCLYESVGFNQLGARKDYYPAGDKREDALLYAKSLIV